MATHWQTDDRADGADGQDSFGRKGDGWQNIGPTYGSILYGLALHCGKAQRMFVSHRRGF
jgi:hypothetical protein